MYTQCGQSLGEERKRRERNLEQKNMRENEDSEKILETKKSLTHQNSYYKNIAFKSYKYVTVMKKKLCVFG